MPFQQSTAPRHRHHCTACTMQGHRVDAACAAQSVPAAHDIDAQHCPDDCVLLASHGPMCTYRHITHSTLSSFSANKDLPMSILMATSYSYVQSSPLHSSINVLRANWECFHPSKLSSTDEAGSKF